MAINKRYYNKKVCRNDLRKMCAVLIGGQLEFNTLFFFFFRPASVSDDYYFKL